MLGLRCYSRYRAVQRCYEHAGLLMSAGVAAGRTVMRAARRIGPAARARPGKAEGSPAPRSRRRPRGGALRMGSLLGGAMMHCHAKARAVMVYSMMHTARHADGPRGPPHRPLSSASSASSASCCCLAAPAAVADLTSLGIIHARLALAERRLRRRVQVQVLLSPSPPSVPRSG